MVWAFIAGGIIGAFAMLGVIVAVVAANLEVDFE